jgi:hypothetical protein
MSKGFAHHHQRVVLKKPGQPIPAQVFEQLAQQPQHRLLTAQDAEWFEHLPLSESSNKNGLGFRLTEPTAAIQLPLALTATALKTEDAIYLLLDAGTHAQHFFAVHATTEAPANALQLLPLTSAQQKHIQQLLNKHYLPAFAVGTNLPLNTEVISGLLEKTAKLATITRQLPVLHRFTVQLEQLNPQPKQKELPPEQQKGALETLKNFSTKIQQLGQHARERRNVFKQAAALATQLQQLWQQVSEQRDRQQKLIDQLTPATFVHYLYAVLHNPNYQQLYTYWLAQQLPRIPLYKAFFTFAGIGEELLQLHLAPEAAGSFPLRVTQWEGKEALSWLADTPEKAEVPDPADLPERSKGRRKYPLLQVDQLWLNKDFVVEGLPETLIQARWHGKLLLLQLLQNWQQLSLSEQVSKLAIVAAASIKTAELKQQLSEIEL